MTPPSSPIRRRDIAAVLFALILPSVVTWLYFFQAESLPANAEVAIFSVVKALQFVFPIFWVLAVQRGPITLRPPHGGGVKLGLAFGAGVVAAMFALYGSVLRGSELLAGANDQIVAKVNGWNINNVWEYAALSLFYSLIHSLLEEYYWRWFVFGQLRRLVSLNAAIAISSLGFAAHHVLVLGKFFGFDNPATWLFSACIALGGAVWAWLYNRSGSLLGPWLSHMLVDAAIFAIGYDLVRGTLT